MFRRVAVVMLSLPVAALAASGARPVAVAAIPDNASAATATHVLNRVAFGPRPGEVAQVQRVGIQTWIDEQLHPERIDDRALTARLTRFETLSLDTSTILHDYYAPAMQERRARQRKANAATAPEHSSSTSSPDSTITIPQGPETPRPQDLPASERNARLVLAELSEARILRAVYSERQLQEVLTDFWFNHFNVFAGKGPTRAFVTSFERDAIRPHVLGDFRQMLQAVAESPAMLFYLDNWQNVQPQAGSRMAGAGRTSPRSGRFGPARPQQSDSARPPKASRGINENYARELLELHTLGVDGGYTQDDVINVARAFTGWTMRPRQEARFQFVRQLHDASEKHVLGHTLKAGRGIEDGRDVLDILVAHPSTARFIATRLAEKFVSDTPPLALVDRAAARFRETRGNLREVTRVILSSPEFLAAGAQRAKVKTPLEFVASALRATGAEVATALPLIRVLRDLGMPLYFCQPPTGYEEKADTWVSSGALVARMNFALELGGGRLRGITVPGLISPAAVGERLVSDILAGDVSEATRGTIARGTTAEQAIALVIGSPEFQRQ